jgi:hypothetical protein
VAKTRPDFEEASGPSIVYVIGGGCFKNGTLPPDARMRVIAATQLLVEYRRARRACQIVLLGGTFRSKFNDAIQELAFLKRAYWDRYSIKDHEVRLLAEGHSTAHQVELIRREKLERRSGEVVIANDWQLGYVRELCRHFKMDLQYESVEDILIRRRRSWYTGIVEAFVTLPCVVDSKKRAAIQLQFVEYLGFVGYGLLMLLWKILGTYMPPRPRHLYRDHLRNASAEFSR